jgi:hypothetical protein
MGHDITLHRNGGQIKDCFPKVGEGNYRCVNDKPLPLQSSLYITHNVSDIIYKALAAIDPDKLEDINSFGAWLHGRRCQDAIAILKQLYTEIALHQLKYQPLEPTNGWGSYESLLLKLKALILACETYPDAVVQDWY